MREVFLPGGLVVLDRVAGLGTDVINHNFEVHLGLAAEPLYIRQKVALVRANGAAQGVVILKCRAKAKRKNGRTCEAAGDDSSVVTGGGLCLGSCKPCGVFGQMLRDDYGEISGWKEECLIAEESGNTGQGHWTTMTCKL